MPNSDEEREGYKKSDDVEENTSHNDELVHNESNDGENSENEEDSTTPPVADFLSTVETHNEPVSLRAVQTRKRKWPVIREVPGDALTLEGIGAEITAQIVPPEKRQDKVTFVKSLIYSECWDRMKRQLIKIPKNMQDYLNAGIVSTDLGCHLSNYDQSAK